MNDKAFVSVFIGLNENLRRVARRWLQSDDDVSDTLQDAFCRLWVRRQVIESEEQARAMSVVTVKNLSIDKLRHNTHMAGQTADIVMEQRGVSPMEEMDRHEQFEMVKQLVDTRLTAMQREVFGLKEFDGLDTDEIARRLDISIEAVRMNLSRARRTIRECYKQWNK